MEQQEKIVVLILCYSEEATISTVIVDFKRGLPEADTYVYDNNSTDRTYELAAQGGAIVKKEPRQGKENVIRQMFLDIDVDYYLMVDDDDTYPVEAVHGLFEKLRSDEVDMVIGDRLSNRIYLDENKRPLHDFGNNLVRDTITRVYKTKIPDVMTGYRGSNRIFVKSFPIMSFGFQIEAELTIHALDKKFKFVETPTEYRDRPEGSISKLNISSDGFKVIIMIIKICKDYKPLLFFGIWITFFFLFGLVTGTPVICEYMLTSSITRTPSAISSTGSMTLALLSLVTGLISDMVVTNTKKEYELNLYHVYHEYHSRKQKKDQGCKDNLQLLILL